MKKTLSKLIRKLVPRKLVPPPNISPEHAKICDQVRERNLSFLSKNAIYSLVRLMEEIESNAVDGTVIEAGCALGGSSIAICAAKHPPRIMNLYDTFEMIPPPTEEDGEDVHARYEVISSGHAKGIEGEEYYGYLDNIRERVTQSFDDFGYAISANRVTLNKGLLQDTMAIDEPVALAHIDVDWYDPVYTCLERIVPYLSKGGAIVLDDYFAWSGCRKATDEYFAKKKKDFMFCTKYGHLVVRHRA